MNPNLLNETERRLIIEEIKGSENTFRKKEAFYDYEVYNDRYETYVKAKLIAELTAKTVAKMPIIAQLNIGKRIVKAEAKVYNSTPIRTFSDITDADKNVLESIYKEMGFNKAFKKANVFYKYRKQAFLRLYLQDKNITLRNINAHQIDVIPDFENPEKAFCYVTSRFDKSSLISSDNVNQKIADSDDSKLEKERYLFWTSEYNLICNGKGELISDVVENPTKDLGYIDVNENDKDYEFFVRQGQTLSDFTVSYNSSWSDDQYIKRMQGFSIGVISGDASLLPQDLNIGPSSMVLMPKNASTGQELSLDFKSPNTNLDSLGKMRADLLADFLMSRGVDKTKISSAMNGANSYSSAIDRLLAMVDEFEATKEDFDLFEKVELQVFECLKKHLAEYSGTELLDKKYWTSKTGILNAKMSIQFQKPEMIETKAEKLTNAKYEKDLGITDNVEILMNLYGLTEEQAIEKLKKIEERKSILNPMLEVDENETDDRRDGSQSDYIA